MIAAFRFSRPGAFRRVATSLGLLAAALAQAQEVVAWGNSFGHPEVPPAGLSRVLDIAAGVDHALALRADGTVVGWGTNTFHVNDIPAGLKNVVAITTGGAHCMALRADGTVVAWGDDAAGPLAVPADLGPALAVEAGDAHSLALKADGTVRAWGENLAGQCNVPAGLTGVKAISAGGAHSMALRTNGTVVCWGGNSKGQSGVPGGLTGVVAISAGAEQSIALKSDGTVVCWGSPVNSATGLNGVVGIAAGYWHGLALKSNGTVTTWSSPFDFPSAPNGLSGVTAIAAGTGAYALRGQTIVEVERTDLYGGESATGKLFVPTPAPAGGTTVALTSSDPSVVVPASVTVPPGARSVAFPIASVLFFGADRNVTIQPATGLSDTLKVAGQTAALALNATALTGASTTKPTLTLTLKWPSFGPTTFALAASDAGLTLPPTITVPAGATSAKLVVGHELVPTDRAATIAAAFDGQTVASVGLALRALKPTLKVTPLDPDPETTVTVRVSLSAFNRDPVEVALTSAHPTIAVPAILTIPAGAREASFTIPVGIDAAGRRVLLTATANGNVAKATLKVHAYPLVKSVAFPTAINGRTKFIGTVRLVAAAPAGGAKVRIVSNSPAFTVPEYVKVPEGQYAVLFPAVAADVAVETPVSVTASNDASSAAANVTVKPLAVVSFTLSTATVKGGVALTGTLSLSADVAAGTSVQIESDEPSVKVPAVVSVLANGRTVTFNITTKAVTVIKYIRITVRKHGSSIYRTLKVTP